MVLRDSLCREGERGPAGKADSIVLFDSLSYSGLL